MSESRDITSFRRMHPQKFLLWVYIISTTMIFAALSSAVLVSMADAVQNGTWRFFSLPDSFTVSTLVVLLSSASMQYAYNKARQDAQRPMRLALLITMGLGAIFLAIQFLGFTTLFELGIALVDNNFVNPAGELVKSNSGGFLYIIVGMHGLHLLGALAVLLVMGILAFMNRLHPGRLLGLELATIFWHALGFLWLYLFIFLSVIYSS
ncbi:MAG: cytochrome c oxidase subunit 3 [Bacteroidetes bacterium]|jgi:cytochrome c oxidase subunit 3|nr:cytochrome c oxidase subunit 3 [Bacteroidota bacterium]